MTIWAIADIHASARDPVTSMPTKPMDVFGPAWTDHVDRLESAWNERVEAGDTVIIAGDIDWALRLEDAAETLRRIDKLPGSKILLRGNHDYWWSSKTTNKVRRALPPSMVLLHNNAVQVENYNICGAKGSPVPGAIDWTDQNEKLLKRESQRLITSLEARDPGLATIVALHYPPFYRPGGSSTYRTIVDSYGVDMCIYGHLHGDAAALGPTGRHGTVEYHLVAGDAVGFAPVRLACDGRRVAPATA